MITNNLYAAIDPMALILSGKAYDGWVQLHYPHEPKVSEISELVARMSPEDEQATLKRARTLAEYVKAVEEAVGKKAALAAGVR